MGQLQTAIDQRRKRIADLQAELPLVSERSAKAIQGSIEELGNQIWDIEHSHGYTAEQQTERESAAIHSRWQKRQALEQRRQARMDAIRADREHYDGLIEAFNWTLAPELPTLDARRAVARAHAEKVSARDEELTTLREALRRDDLLAEIAYEQHTTPDVALRIIEKEVARMSSERLESLVHDQAGRGYLLVTDSQGTWCERSITADADGSDGGSVGSE